MPTLKKGSIVKVQIPIMTNDVRFGTFHLEALVYNKSREYEVYMDVTKELHKEMNGSPKKFFYAHYDEENNNTVLEGEAPWQEW